MQAACSVCSLVTWPTGIKLIDVTIMRIKNFVITISLPFSNSFKDFNCVLFGSSIRRACAVS